VTGVLGWLRSESDSTRGTSRAEAAANHQTPYSEPPFTAAYTVRSASKHTKRNLLRQQLRLTRRITQSTLSPQAQPRSQRQASARPPHRRHVPWGTVYATCHRVWRTRYHRVKQCFAEVRLHARRHVCAQGTRATLYDIRYMGGYFEERIEEQRLEHWHREANVPAVSGAFGVAARQSLTIPPKALCRRYCGELRKPKAVAGPHGPRSSASSHASSAVLAHRWSWRNRASARRERGQGAGPP
jgi:hypothetical protein